MSEVLEGYVLEQDGCHIDNQGVQHYLYPREVEGIEDTVELARYEFAWHTHPECQGQWEEGDETVSLGAETLDALVEEMEEAGVTYLLFPRETFVNYIGEDWDAIAYCEWKWYLAQAK
jgi:hypothetical protein